MRRAILPVVLIGFLATGCTVSPMDLALAGRPNKVQFAFPGHACECITTLSLYRGTPGSNQIVWAIEADEPRKLPIPMTIGDTPAGFRTKTPLPDNALSDAAGSDEQLEFSSGTRHSQLFRLSEMSATDRVVEIGHSRFVTTYDNLPDYVHFYQQDHAKEDRGHRRYAAFLIGLAIVLSVVIVVFRRRRRRQVKPTVGTSE